MNAEDYLSDEERNYLQDYLDELDGLEALSEGEKEAVTISAMAGEADAQAKLIEIFLHEVVEIAKIYTGMGVYLEDLIGEGNVALTMGVSMLGCVETPAEAQGMLAKLIMDAMEELVAENAEVQKADKKIEDRVNKVMKKANELSEELRRKVSVAELSKESGMSESYIREAVRFSGYKIDAIEEDAT